MRCTGCGLPLSPQRTSCPRCGKAAGEPEAQANNQAEMPQYAFPSFQEQNNIPADMSASQKQAIAATQQRTNDETIDELLPSSETEPTPSQSNQILLPDPDKTLQSTAEQPANWQSSSQPEQRSASPGEFRPFPQPPHRPGEPHSRYALQPSFPIAGLCVLSGGLILLLVYIISLTLPSLSTANQSASTTANTPISQTLPAGTQRSSQANATPTLIPTVKPAPAFPGKAYIDNAQTGSSLNFNTAQLYQATTNFTVNQKVFVTFMLHPVNTGGAVCLLWYVNQIQFSQFTFAVGPVSEHAYSFASATSAGQGSVAIYWASSTACTDKILAQVVNFTVAP